MREKYTFNIKSADLHKKLILSKGASESRQHIAMKLLSLILFYQEALTIEKKVSQKYKPDLAAFDSDKRIRLWIDCGHISFTKVAYLLRRNRQAQLVVVKKDQRLLLPWFKELKIRLRKERHYNIRLLCFENGFVQNLSSSISKNNTVEEITKSEERIQLTLNKERLESRIYGYELKEM